MVIEDDAAAASGNSTGVSESIGVDGLERDVSVLIAAVTANGARSVTNFDSAAVADSLHDAGALKAVSVRRASRRGARVCSCRSRLACAAASAAYCRPMHSVCLHVCQRRPSRVMLAFLGVCQRGACVGACRLQIVMFGSLRLRVTIAALSSFVSSRRSDNPLYVLSFALGMNVMLVLLFVLASVYLHVQEALKTRMLMAAEQHQRKLTEAAREAHEKTIAYACHQLR